MRTILVGMVGMVLVTGVLAEDTAAQARRRARPYARVDVERTIRRLEVRSDHFRETVDRQLDRSRLDGSRTEDRINDEIKDLENALDDLRDEFDRRDRFEESRRHVPRALSQSDEVNSLFRRRNLGRQAEREWAEIRADLNLLAAAYNLRPLR